MAYSFMTGAPPGDSKYSLFVFVVLDYFIGSLLTSSPRYNLHNVLTVRWTFCPNRIGRFGDSGKNARLINLHYFSWKFKKVLQVASN